MARAGHADERDVVEDAAITEIAALGVADAVCRSCTCTSTAGIALDDEPAVRAHLWRAGYGRTVRRRMEARTG